MAPPCSFCGFKTKYSISAKRHLKTCKAAKLHRELQQHQQNIPNVLQGVEIDADLISKVVSSVLKELAVHTTSSTTSTQQQEIIIQDQRELGPEPSASSSAMAPQRQENNLKRPAPIRNGVPSKQSCLRCDVCNITCVSQVLLNAHEMSQDHMQKVSTQHLGTHVTAIENAAIENRILTLNINHLEKTNIDIRTFLNRKIYLILHLIQEQLDIINPLKINLEIFADYSKQTERGETIDLKSFVSDSEMVTLSTNLLDLIKPFSEKLIEMTDNFSQQNSEWQLVTVSHISIIFNK